MKLFRRKMKERKTKSEVGTKRKENDKTRKKCEFGFANLALAASRGFDGTAKKKEA